MRNKVGQFELKTTTMCFLIIYRIILRERDFTFLLSNKLFALPFHFFFVVEHSFKLIQKKSI